MSTFFCSFFNLRKILYLIHAVYSESLVLQGIESFYGCRKKISEKRKKSDTDFMLIFDFRTIEKTACPYRFFNKLS